MCVCRHLHVVPLCSRHDLITLRFHYPGPLLPSSLASQDYMVWYLGCVAAQPFLNVCMVSLITSDLSFYAPFLSIRVSLILWNTWSILYRLYSNLIMSLLGRSCGAKLVMTYSFFSGQCLASRLASQLAIFILSFFGRLISYSLVRGSCQDNDG